MIRRPVLVRSIHTECLYLRFICYSHFKENNRTHRSRRSVLIEPKQFVTFHEVISLLFSLVKFWWKPRAHQCHHVKLMGYQAVHTKGQQMATTWALRIHSTLSNINLKVLFTSRFLNLYCTLLRKLHEVNIQCYLSQPNISICCKSCL